MQLSCNPITVHMSYICKSFLERNRTIQGELASNNVTSSHNEIFEYYYYHKGSGPVHVAPACIGSGKGSTALGRTMQSFPTFLQEA